MFKRVSYSLSVFLLLLLVSIVSAQALFIQSLGDHYSIKTPQDWTVELNADRTGYVLENERISMLLLTPENVTDLLSSDSSKTTRFTTEIALTRVIERLDAIDLNRRDLEEITFAGREGWRWEYVTKSKAEGAVMTFEIEDEGYLYIDFVSEDDLEEVYPIIESILETFLVLQRTGTVITATPTATEEVQATPTFEPCLVSTSKADTARLRVGPGENRSAIAFLAVDEDFSVTGRFVTDDDSVWYQLDKAQVAPDSSAAELWVAAAEVTETGDCDVVLDASAPPIVPITSGGNTTTGSTTPGSTAVPGTLPGAGTWTMYLDSTTYASCLNTETITFPTSEAFTSLTIPVSVGISSDGITVLFAGIALGQTSPGNYVGSFDMGGSDNFQIYIAVQSANSMTGRLVGNTIYEGRGCSVTTYFSASR